MDSWCPTDLERKPCMGPLRGFGGEYAATLESTARSLAVYPAITSVNSGGPRGNGRVPAKGELSMLGNADALPMLPVKDLAAAQKFYEETLGLKRLHVETDVVATYQSGNSTLNVYRSEFAGTNKGTAALWEVDDVEGTVKQLKAKGVTFEHYNNLPGLKLDGDIHRAGPFSVAWF